MDNFESAYGKIEKTLSNLRSQLNRLDIAGKEVDTGKLSALKEGFSKVKTEFEGISLKSEIAPDVDQIRKYLFKIEDGEDYTGPLKSHAHYLVDFFDRYRDLKKSFESLEQDLIDFYAELEEEKKDTLPKKASLTEMLDNVASTLQAKGLTKEASELDVISNSIESLLKQAL